MRRAGLRAALTGVATACLFAVMLSGSVSPGASADSVTDRKKALDERIAQLRDELEGTSREFAEAAVTLQRSQVELVDVRAKLSTARSELARAQAHDAAVASQLAFAQAEEAKAVLGLQEQYQAETELRAQLGLIARQTYVSSGAPGLSGLSVALQAEGAEEFVERLNLAGAALQSRSGAVQRLAVQQADLRARTEKLAAIRAQVAQLKARSEVAVATRKAAESTAAATEHQQAQLVARQTSALALIRARAATERAGLNQMVAQQNQLAAVLAARARAAAVAHHSVAGPPPPASSGWIGSPVNGPITSGFGPRFHPILHYYRMHTGVDFGAGCGTPVYAVADGTVISAGWAGGYGNRLVIDHGWTRGAGLASTYNHLSGIVVRGGSVHHGQLVGHVGTTGLSTGCHLHFETLVNGSYVDPRKYL